MASKMKYDRKTGKYVDKSKGAPQPLPFDENGYNAWRSGNSSMYDMLLDQLRGVHGELDEGAAENVMRQIYGRGASKKALRQIEKNYGLKDISGKGRSDANVSKEIRETRGVDKNNQPVPQKPVTQPSAKPAQQPKPAAQAWNPSAQVKNSNAAIAAVTDQQIANGAWFEHSKQGKVKITKAMRDWAKDFIEKSKPKNETKPATAPDTSSAPVQGPTAAQQAAADKIPQTVEQKKASAFQDLARTANAAKADEAVRAREQSDKKVREGTMRGQYTPRTSEQTGAAEAQEYARMMNAARAREGKDVRLGQYAGVVRQGMR